MSSELAGKIALVTGATRGIGRAVAERFIEAGGRVAVCGRRESDAKSVAAELGANATGVELDVRSSQAVHGAVRSVLGAWGRIDVLVNNAGVAIDNFLTRFTDERWDDSLQTNLSGPFRMIRAVVPPMKESGGGSIVNLGSWAGLRGNPGQAAYSASKSGLVGLSLTAAKELGRFGIRVNMLCPLAATEMNGVLSDEQRASYLDRLSLPRWGKVSEVAEGVLFLASDRSSYTTGQVLNVDGGLHLS